MRKAGPGFPLEVVRCSAHGASFTLYPIGWAPFGRVAIACVDPGGGALGAGSEVPTATLLRAALDAACGKLWAIAQSEGCCRRTQGRRIGAAAKVLGIWPGLEDRAREQVAVAIRLPLLELQDAARAFTTHRSWRARGELVRAFFSRVGVSPGALDGLLRAGSIAGNWGRPSRWDPGGEGRGRLVQLF